MATPIKRSFSGGELSPALQARSDTVKYQTGLRTERNTLTRRDGGSQSRPGTEYISEVRDSDSLVRLVPFIFNNDQTYILEFTNEYVRVYQDGYPLLAEVVAAGQNVTGVSLAATCIISLADESFLNDTNEVYFENVGGTTELNNNYYSAETVAPGQFELYDNQGLAPIDSTLFTAFTSGGTVKRVVGFTTDYQETELMDLQFVQSADTLTISHPNYRPMEIVRTSAYEWSIDFVEFSPISDGENIDGRDLSGGPRDVDITPGGAGAVVHRYTVTAIDDETGEETFVSTGDGCGITAATKANPCVLSINSATFDNKAVAGQWVFISAAVAGSHMAMSQLENRFFKVLACDNTTLTIDVDSTLFDTFTGTESVYLAFDAATCAAPTTIAPHLIAWGYSQSATGVRGYNVYKETNGVYAYLATTTEVFYSDTGALTPDTAITPPFPRYEFRITDKYPSAVTRIQQRLLFANTNSNPETVYLSKTGSSRNFARLTPTSDDASFSFTMAGRRVNQIKHMVDIGELVIFTSDGEWSATGGANEALTPGNVNLKQHSYNGSGNLPPIVLSGNALYVQSRGSIVRDLSFDYQIDGYRGNDLTTFSGHLFENHTIYDWTYQQVPNSIIWAARDDGVLLALTYVREQQILAWHHHDFENGFIESVCAIPEGQEDALYLVVRRTIDGVAKKYVERMVTRKVDDIVDYVGMDSCLTYDGRNTDAAHTMDLSGGTTWANTETLTITSSASFFTAADVGNEIHLSLEDADGNVNIIRFTLNAYTSATVMTGRAHKTVPADMRGPLSSWSRAVDRVSGLGHLEGETVSILADGFVVASPNNSSYTAITVTDAAVDLPKCYAVIHVGLPITADIETLDIDSPGDESIASRGQIIQEIVCFLDKTRGGFVGPSLPDGADPLENMVEFKPRSTEDYDSPAELKTGKFKLQILSEWGQTGRIAIRQVDPLPMSVLALVPSGFIPLGGQGG